MVWTKEFMNFATGCFVMKKGNVAPSYHKFVCCKKNYLRYTCILRWVEKFSVMAAVLAIRYPVKAPELLAYHTSIVKGERNFNNNGWSTSTIMLQVLRVISVWKVRCSNSYWLLSHSDFTTGCAAASGKRFATQDGHRDWPWPSFHGHKDRP